MKCTSMHFLDSGQLDFDPVCRKCATGPALLISIKSVSAQSLVSADKSLVRFPIVDSYLILV